MPHFCFGGWTHAEAGRSHKSACLKERYYMPTCARPDLNICTLGTLMQPYFFDIREIFLLVRAFLALSIHRQTVAPIPFERINSIWLPCRRQASGGSVSELSPSVITKSESNVRGESCVGLELEGIPGDDAKSSGNPALLL